MAQKYDFHSLRKMFISIFGYISPNGFIKKCSVWNYIIFLPTKISGQISKKKPF